MSQFDYGEFVNEPIYPLREQTPMHLHDRDGLGNPITDDPSVNQFPDISYTPGGWTPFTDPYGQDGRDGAPGLKGLPGKPGLNGPPSKNALTASALIKFVKLDTTNGVLDYFSTTGFVPFLALGGLLRFESGTLLEVLDWSSQTFGSVTFPTSDPGGGKIWLSPT